MDVPLEPQYLSDDDSAITSMEVNGGGTQGSTGGTQGSGGGTQRAVWEPTQMISGTIEMHQSNWGRLVPSDMKTDSQGKPYVWTSKDLEKTTLYIGRVSQRLEAEMKKKDEENKDIFVVDDPVVSSFHCILEQDDEENVWLTDKSTNGTWVNKTKVGRGKRRLVSDGDEITLVTKAKFDRRSKRPRKKISFLYYSVNTEDDEISATKRKYHFKEKLGTGSFAEVWLGIHRMEGTKVAIKDIDMKRYKAMSTDASLLQNEINVMTELNHPNIIRLEENTIEGDHLYLILEYAAYGDLAKVIFDAHKKGGKRLEGSVIYGIFSQVFEAISHVHAKGLIHRDLKPDNVLLSSLDPMVLKLTDFGLARNAVGATSAVGSQIYSAPEVFEGEYSTPVDFWSLGCILYALFNGNPPFYDGKSREPFRVQQKTGPKFPKSKFGQYKYARDLICRLLMVSPKKRIKEAKIREHKWCKKFKKRKLSDPEVPTPKRQNTEESIGSLLDSLAVNTQATLQTSQALPASENSNEGFLVPRPRKKFRRS